MSTIQELLIAALPWLGGLVVSTAFLLALFVGFCVIFGFPKLRPTSRSTRVVRSLDELVGQAQPYLPPDAPRGPADQLHTPELLELAARKSP